MSTMKDYFNFIFVNLGFISMIFAMFYFRTTIDIKKNWSIYRCNPSYWIFSDNIAKDFSYCVQNTQMNNIGYLLQPLNYMISSLTSISGGLNKSINDSRIMSSNTRKNIADIVENIFGVFINIIVEFQKIIVNIKDVIGKMIGIIFTILYILDSSIKSINIKTDGNNITSIGSCFHPDTLVKTYSGEIYKMKDLPLGAILENGGKVFSVLKVDNDKKVPLYKINNGVNNDPILVTGEHFIYDNKTNKWIKVKDCEFAEIYSNKCDWFSCLITTDRNIKIGEHLFWDWEDDELNINYNK